MQESVAYYDGLGRPVQQVAWQGSPAMKDIVQPIVYDMFGRDSVKYLPYTGGNDGSFKDNAVSEQNQFYQSLGYQYPYSKIVFEPSPLNRVLEQGAPGADKR